MVVHLLWAPLRRIKQEAQIVLWDKLNTRSVRIRVLVSGWKKTTSLIFGAPLIWYWWISEFHNCEELSFSSDWKVQCFTFFSMPFTPKSWHSGNISWNALTCKWWNKLGHITYVISPIFRSDWIVVSSNGIGEWTHTLLELHVIAVIRFPIGTPANLNGEWNVFRVDCSVDVFSISANILIDHKLRIN